jgi:hypothetical protein
MALNLDVKILGDYKNLTKATRGARKELTQFEKATKGISKNIKASLAGIAAGFAVGALVDQFKTLTKAAIEDNKSQAQLALTLRNVVGANDAQIISIEKSIAAWQTQTGILDDNLRPAYQALITSTGSVTKANELMQVALDTSTATGKPLATVANAIGRSFNGSNIALNKLLPALKNAKNPLDLLKAAFEGSAVAAADLDPYLRLDAVLNDVQERIGNALLPKLQEFATYLGSAEGIKKVDDFTNAIIRLADALTKLVDPFVILVNNNNSFADVIKNAATGFDVLSPGGLGRLAQRRQDAGLNVRKSAGNANYDPRGYVTPKNKAASLFEELFGKLAGGTGNSSASKESAAITRLKANLATLQTAYTDAAKAIKESMQSFQSEATSGFGLISNGDVQYFSVEKLISTMKRVKDAAANFATNIAKLKKKGATASLIDQIVGLGAEQGGTVAEGLLKSGKLSTVLKLYKGVGKLGTSVGTAQAKIDNGATQSQLKTAIDKLSGSIAKGGSTYNIKVTKSDASAVDIITAIRKYERTSGRNYLVN